jgi:AbiV family abortive infection protein
VKRKRTLTQYQGKLSPALVAAGMSAAARNAQRLFDDASILFEAKRFPSACSLAVLSIEESGKIAILRRLATAQSDEMRKPIWREYRNHQSKNLMWIVAELVRKGARTIEELRVIVDPTSDHPSLIDNVKQLGFYTDCCGDANWSEPHVVVEEALAKSILFAAKVLIPKREIPVREMELWIEHVGSYPSNSEAFEGIVAFYRAMQAEGLDCHTPEEIGVFLGLKAADPI